MSHFVTLKTKVLDDVNVSMVRRAIKRMDKHLDVEPASKHPNVSSFNNFNAIVMRDGQVTTIRMNFEPKEDGKISLTIGGEFYRTGADLDSFSKKLSRNYSELKIEQHAKTQNMIPVKKTVKENGDVVLRFRVAS